MWCGPGDVSATDEEVIHESGGDALIRQLG
jgi:hypothetical protein